MMGPSSVLSQGIGGFAWMVAAEVVSKAAPLAAWAIGAATSLVHGVIIHLDIQNAGDANFRRRGAFPYMVGPGLVATVTVLDHLKYLQKEQLKEMVASMQ